VSDAKVMQLQIDTKKYITSIISQRYNKIRNN
jgi:hypothetical protein